MTLHVHQNEVVMIFNSLQKRKMLSEISTISKSVTNNKKKETLLALTFDLKSIFRSWSV